MLCMKTEATVWLQNLALRVSSIPPYPSLHPQPLSLKLEMGIQHLQHSHLTRKLARNKQRKGRVSQLYQVKKKKNMATQGSCWRLRPQLWMMRQLRQPCHQMMMTFMMRLSKSLIAFFFFYSPSQLHLRAVIHHHAKQSLDVDCPVNICNNLT